MGLDGRARDIALATSERPVAQILYDCALPATVGVPMPSVTAAVLAWGLGLRGDEVPSNRWWRSLTGRALEPAGSA